MKQPSLKTRMLGHAIVVLPTTGVTLWSVYAVVQDSEVWPMTASLVAATGIVMKANEQASAYKAWARAWDGMAPAKPSLAHARWRQFLAIPVIGAMIAYLAAHTDEPGYGVALGWLVIGSTLVAIILLARRMLARQKTRPSKAETVTICITRPLLAVPTMTDAYRALPAHCWQVMQPART